VFNSDLTYIKSLQVQHPANKNTKDSAVN